MLRLPSGQTSTYIRGSARERADGGVHLQVRLATREEGGKAG